MKTQLDMDKIAAALGAERRGKVVPAGGGRATDPRWTERRLVPLGPRTLERLEAISHCPRHVAKLARWYIADHLRY